MTKYKSLSAEILCLAKRVDIQQIAFLLLYEHLHDCQFRCLTSKLREKRAVYSYNDTHCIYVHLPVLKESWSHLGVHSMQLNEWQKIHHLSLCLQSAFISVKSSLWH